ncbi:Gfo/Idh/MocA family oxidoreductase [Brucepastera parasyntrophica]|uniref:Gfo/Idh/MocA family protein n=1 Tax=Brucepastera parasyntrophica TaxID=2880008 RepID=UPI00210A1300|nr:Gfo/Idh/MocA family oxidoreductase [Brucepastera parasyntrophica]ULQ60800.1 Gfo/Idh/MocA family oxidoreductase [Brucepastera parasyntrophica]
MENIKIGIIGAGGMLPYHYKGFTKAGAQVVAIADANTEKAKTAAAPYGIEKTYDSLIRMIEDNPDINAVSVLTPNKFHMPLAIEALANGKHVYCEKPPALNASEMKVMLDEAKRSGKRLMFAFNNRARPESQAIMKYIRNGRVGAINSAQATWIRRAGIPGFGGWFTTKELSGGGPVIDLLHMIDLALYFMDYPEPDYVLARTFYNFMDNKNFKGPWGIPDAASGITDVESSCHAMLTFKSGQSLMIRNSWAEMNEREVVSVVFQGKKAGGKVERLFGRDGFDETSIDSCRLFTEENGNQVNRDILVEKDETMGRIASAANFIESIQGTSEPLSTPEQALSLMKITDAIYESASAGKPVQIK